MECHCIRLTDVPHTTRLSATFVEDFGRVSRFFAHPPTDEGILEAAREVHDDDGPWRTVVEVLREQNRQFGCGRATEASLDQLAAGAVAVVTGQQVGLFTGPSYSIYKAMTAIHLARQLTKRGTPAVPVFWLATEDHDLAEINHAFWSSRADLERLEVLPAVAPGHRVGEVPLGAGISEVVRRAAASLEGPAAENVAQALEQCYRPEETFGSAFGKLIARIFDGYGIILIDPLDARLHRVVAPVYRRALEQHAELTRELLARNKELERAGFHTQVKVTERSTLLFLNMDGQRLPLRHRNAGFAAGQTEFSLPELLAVVDRAPERFTANVLLRPVVQDTLLPTAAYIGGAAEVAYLAQAEVAYRRILKRMPAVLLRASFTLVPPHTVRLLKKYQLEFADVLRGRQHLREKLEREFLPKALAARFDAGEKSIRKVLAGLRRPLEKLDKTLLGARDNAERKMLYQFLRLRMKAGRAEGFRRGVLEAHERELVDTLYPHHALQERSLCFLPFLAAFGAELLHELETRSRVGGSHHQVLYL